MLIIIQDHNQYTFKEPWATQGGKSVTLTGDLWEDVFQMTVKLGLLAE